MRFFVTFVRHLALSLGLLGCISKYISTCSSEYNPTQDLTDIEELESACPRDAKCYRDTIQLKQPTRVS